MKMINSQLEIILVGSKKQLDLSIHPLHHFDYTVLQLVIGQVKLDALFGNHPKKTSLLCYAFPANLCHSEYCCLERRTS